MREEDNIFKTNFYPLIFFLLSTVGVFTESKIGPRKCIYCLFILIKSRVKTKWIRGSPFLQFKSDLSLSGPRDETWNNKIRE